MLTILLLAVGVTFGMAAGACQGLREADGVTLADMVRLLRWSAPARVTAKAALRISGTVSLYALAGGVAVPVYAGMHTVAALSDRAAHLSRDLTNTPEEYV